MAFIQALSGLYGASVGLDAIGANIANASTAGYKQSRAEFSDIFSSYMKSAGGEGALSPTIAQQFTQGSVQATSNDLDFSINGNGLFRMVSDASTSASVAYTRNGEFHYTPVPGTGGTVPAERYIANAQGSLLTGWAPNVATTATPTALTIVDGIASKATTTSALRVNLDDRSAPIAAGTTFNANDPTTYNWSTSQQVFSGVDGDRAAHNLTLYFARQGSATDPTLKSNNWTVYTQLDGQTVGSPQTVSFNALGQLTSGGTLNVAGNVATQVQSSNPTTGAAVVTKGSAPLSFTVDLAQSSQYATGYEQGKSTQNGYIDGFLTGTRLNPDGTLVGTYSNAQTMTVGRVALASFQDMNGLQSIGNNLWRETKQSGAPTIGSADAKGMGVTASNSLEQANVDLAAELVDMIVQQRNYQANAQTIKTQDEMLGTLSALR